MRVLKENIYLDIDGVILTRGVVPAPHLGIFLKYVLSEDISLLKQVRPTSFNLDKTEAIDFSKAFFWLDDDLFDSEKNTLRHHNVLDSWIKLNLMENPDQLMDLIKSRLRCIGGGELYD